MSTPFPLYSYARHWVDRSRLSPCDLTERWWPPIHLGTRYPHGSGRPSQRMTSQKKPLRFGLGFGFRFGIRVRVLPGLDASNLLSPQEGAGLE